jgi:uncharacterized protein
MSGLPIFPSFKPIQIEDRAHFQAIFDEYQPEVSEYAFTNLFTWRIYYELFWCLYHDLLLMTVRVPNGTFYALPPIGKIPRGKAGMLLLDYLKEEKSQLNPSIERADRRFLAELNGSKLTIAPERDQFDYVYKTEDLIKLNGRNLHSKKNHLNKFLKQYRFECVPIDESVIVGCFELLSRWCDYRNCIKCKDIRIECEAAKEVLLHFEKLDIIGCAIKIDGRVEAFTIGEQINKDMAAVHVEKANDQIPGVYAAINQQFCQRYWPEVPFINREQDTGHPGLRKAKMSYHPVRFVEKFKITRSTE